jgi:predicted metal-dependent HD superfamily phosphohydrolase
VTSDLAFRGQELLARLGLPDVGRQAGRRLDPGLVAELLAAYGEPHRRYHTQAHLAAVLHALDEIVAGGDPVSPAVELAAWFHDAVYDPRSAANERDSAKLARSRLEARSAPPELVDDVERLVMVTAGHAATAADEAAMVDADLAILGAEPAVYTAYAEAVRAEYEFVSQEAWRRGRAAVLRSLRELDPLFRTAAFTPRAAQARANLDRELAILAG